MLEQQATDNEFPGWDIISGAVNIADWLQSRGFASPAEAWVRGVRGPWLDHFAVQCWCHDHGYATAGAVIALGRLESVPRSLRGEFLVEALIDIFHAAWDKIQELNYNVPASMLAVLKSVQNHLGLRPIPVPTAEMLGSLIQVCKDLLKVKR